MRHIRLLLGLLCLLFGFTANAKAGTNIEVTSTYAFDVLTDGNRYALGTVTVGQVTTVNLTLRDVISTANRVTGSIVGTDGVTVGGTTVSPGTAAEFAVTGPTRGTINLASTAEGLKASFSGTGEAIVKDGSINLTLSVKPLLAGNLTVLISFSQTLVGDEAYFYFTLTAVSPPPKPPPPPPIKPYVRVLFDQPDLSGAVIRVPAHLIWGGDSPKWELDRDFAKIKWAKNGLVVAIGKDPWLEVASGDTITVSAVSTDGVIYTSAPEVFRVVSFSPPPAFDPGDSGYHPKPKPRKTNQASGLTKTATKVGSRRGKPVAVESATWGEVKNMER
ncbi:MAG: hypothetical protein AAB880_02445 [Patescibacteria group bacterium]